MYYSLYAPMWDTNATLRKLLKEVLGYNDDEINIMESEWFDRNIANNLTLEQAQAISTIFCDNDFQIYLNDGSGVDGTIYWNQLGIRLKHEPPKDHYCDQPLVSREQLADLSIPKKKDPPITGFIYDTKPVVECPYCHSADTKKISGFSKAGSLALFGIFAAGKASKQLNCKKCGSDFYTYFPSSQTNMFSIHISRLFRFWKGFIHSFVSSLLVQR